MTIAPNKINGSPFEFCKTLLRDCGTGILAREVGCKWANRRYSQEPGGFGYYEMKRIGNLAVILVLASMVSSCATRPPRERFVRQEIPVEIQAGKAIQLRIVISGVNQVGIRCSPEMWNELMKTPDSYSVRLVSTNKKGTEIDSIIPGAPRRFPIEPLNYLFRVSGEYRAKALVEIVFRNTPPGVPHAESIVSKSSGDFFSASG